MSRAAERRAEAARAQQITEELVAERKDWTLTVYKRDYRCKAGERLVKKYAYPDWTQDQMAAEVKDLRQDLYKTEDGWRLEFAASWYKTKSLMTGQEVTIRAEDRGTCCDPSQERFWSM
jgi:hypothetical protein